MRCCCWYFFITILAIYLPYAFARCHRPGHMEKKRHERTRSINKIISDYVNNELSKVSHPHKRSVIQEEKPSPEYETVFFSAEDATGDLPIKAVMFNISKSLPVVFAEEGFLRIFLKNTPGEIMEEADVILQFVSSEGEPSSILFNRTLPVLHDSFIEVSLRGKRLKRILESPDDFMGIFVATLVDGENRAIYPNDDKDGHKNMLLWLKLRQPGRRVRRDALTAPISKPMTEEEIANTPFMKHFMPGYTAPGSVECSIPYKDNDTCCLGSHTISFPLNDYKFIIAPRKYDAYVCRGSCSLRHHLYNPAAHAQAIHVTGDKSTEKTDTGGCCHATRYAPLRMVTVGHRGKWQVTEIRGVVARECACT
ncbi:hypothetical protein WR25_02802 [Diploscapter pachys]|uniref:TGF-beta family profile domain-containing protein n=1 Tax=Diploscapter pachys TaxID=2018661 RepID=A0A2A2LY24_9BILA|nr:hypothetical protein WR25_02802 [Diploscapter pachys]